MAKLDIDYSLPYDEYLENFRKTHHPQAIALSEDQYNFNKAAAEKQAKMNAAKEAGTAEGAWAYQKGPSDEILEKHTGNANPTKEEVKDVANEIIGQRITSEQQGIQSKGNKGDDHINNPDALDTADITKLGKKALASVQTEDNMNPATYSISNGDRVQMMKDAGISPEKIENEVNTTMSDSVSDAVTPKENDTPKQAEAKGKYNKSMMSIWDAYRNGDIDKETAGYFTIDAIATLAKNLGRSIGNVGAQFSGGTIDNGHDESKWGQRQNALLNEEIGMETENLGGAAGRKAESESLDNQAKRIRNAYTPAQLEQQIEMFKRDLEMADINLDMAHSRTDLINYIKSDPDYTNSPFKMGLVAYLTQAGVSGATNSASKTLGDAINWILTLTK